MMTHKPPSSPDLTNHLEAFRSHPRHFHGSQLVYPVVSRRSRGISIGVNLNPDKNCNFNCLYCQVDRRAPKTPVTFSLTTLETELTETIDTVLSGRLYESAPFDQTPVSLRRLNDIALSGDGEPTASKDFLAACELSARLNLQLCPENVRLVLITNSSLLDRPSVRQGLKILDAHRGQIWAKLDAGTEAYYHQINQSRIPFERILDNLRLTARIRPIVIQSLFMRVDGQRPDPAEIKAYTDRLANILAAGGQLLSVQLHTIARTPRNARVSPLSVTELDQIAREIHTRVSIPLEKFYAPGS